MVFLFHNNGDSWEQKAIASPQCLSSVVIDSTFFIGTDSGIFISKDYGVSWEQIGLSDTEIYSIKFIGGNVFAVTGEGNLFLSTNDGMGWNKVTANLRTSYSFNIFTDSTYLYASTRDNGLWRRPLSEMIPPPSAVAEASPVSDAVTAPIPSRNLRRSRLPLPLRAMRMYRW